jgi:hypothetical protein
MKRDEFGNSRGLFTSTSNRYTDRNVNNDSFLSYLEDNSILDRNSASLIDDGSGTYKFEGSLFFECVKSISEAFGDAL